jgi:hypothetical protein
MSCHEEIIGRNIVKTSAQSPINFYPTSLVYTPCVQEPLHMLGCQYRDMLRHDDNGTRFSLNFDACYHKSQIVVVIIPPETLYHQLSTGIRSA